jgi:pentatricopeptide repeat protein
MKTHDLLPNSVTYGCLLDACVKNGEIKRAAGVFDCMLRDGIAMNTVLYTTMIKGFSKEWQLEKAYQLYQRMLFEMEANPAVAPNTITYNSLLDCCVRCFDMPRATAIFNDMQ